MNGIRALVILSLFVWLLSFVTAQNPQSIQEICAAAEPSELTLMQFQAADDVLEAGVDYRAVLCTTAGAIYVDLFEGLTPLTVNNFVFLAGQGYYDGTTFHRVIPDFMAQAGDPTGTGRGGPGYQFGDEPIGFLTFDRPGLLAMANAGPGTNGSQFFITTAATPHLNYRHTIFGDVLLGQENVLAIRDRDPQTAAEPGETLQTVVIITDLDSVDEGGMVELEAATRAEVSAAFARLGGETALSTTQDILNALPADLQADFAAFADAYGHQYRYGTRILNSECDAQTFFSSLGYQIDVFADSQAAADAQQDDLMNALIKSQGFAQSDDEAVWTSDKPTCDGESGVHLVTLYTRGRYLVTLDVLLDAALLDQYSRAADLLGRLANQIETSFTDVYASEVR